MRNYIIFITLLFLIPFSLAELDIITYTGAQSGFSLTQGAQEINLCQCELQTDIITVTNNGNYASKYDVLFSDTEYLTVSDGGFELQPKESKSIYLYFKAPCEGKLQDSVIIQIKDVFGNQKTLEKQFSVDTCQNLLASLAVDNNTYGPCEQIDYEVQIENTGAFTETYEVIFGDNKYDTYFDNPYQLTVLESGQISTVKSTLELDCSTNGNLQIPFTVLAKQNELEANLLHDITITPEYPFTIESEAASVCIEKESQIPLTITNDAHFENTFVIKMDAPSFVTLDEKEITLAPFESKTIFAKANSKEIQNVPITFMVQELTGNTAQQLVLDYTSKTCNAAKITIHEFDNVYECADDKSLDVTLQNTGEEESWFWISVYPPEAAFFEIQEEYLKPNETFAGELSVQRPSDDNLHEKIFIKAGIGEDTLAEDTIEVTLLSQQSCYQPILQETFKTTYPFDEKTSIAIKNSGPKDVLYEINYNGDAWAKLEEKPSYKELPAFTQDDVSLLINQTDITYVDYSGNFNVRAFVEDKTYEYNLPFTLHVKQKNIFEKSFNFIKNYPCHATTILLIILIIIVGIIALFRKGNMKFNLTLLVILTIIWVLIAAVNIALYGFPQSANQELLPAEDPLTLRMYQDSALELNLSNYFVDPDNMDMLSYEFDPIDAVNVIVSDDIATLTPIEGWSGSRRIRVTATDENGAQTTSPRLLLEVVPTKEYSAKELYKKYCMIINLVLLLILFLLVYILLAREKQDQKAEKDDPKEPKKDSSKTKKANKKSAAKKVSKSKKKGKK